MSLALLAIVCAGAGAIWLLMRMARAEPGAGEAGNVTLFKAVVFLGLVAALFAAKLWPLAFMTLLAAGAVTGIEMWRARASMDDLADARPHQPSRPALKTEEAASVLGLSVDADEDAIKAAHKKLIGQLHPDKGGTDYLAAQINEARAVLLKAAAQKATVASKPEGAGPQASAYEASDNKTPNPEPASAANEGGGEAKHYEPAKKSDAPAQMAAPTQLGDKAQESDIKSDEPPSDQASIKRAPKDASLNNASEAQSPKTEAPSTDHPSPEDPSSQDRVAKTASREAPASNNENL